MAFLLSNMLAACKIKPQLESEPSNQNKTKHTPSSSTSSTTLAMTGDTGDEEAERLISHLLDIYGKLDVIGGDSLKPGDEVDNLFMNLVGMCIKTINEAVTNKVLNDPRIVPILPSLHRLCGTAECHLESHWAKFISGDSKSSSEEVQTRLSQFPYYTNYTDLTRMELSALTSLLTPSCRPLQAFAFIGSGPLPLTSLCISQTASTFLPPNPPQVTSNTTTTSEKQNEIQVLNIDINPTAITESKHLCDLLGPAAKGMKFQCSPATSPDLDLSAFDVVYLAALVGSTQAEKEDLLESVVARMREGAYLVVRSAERLRRVLYAEFDPTSEKVLKCLDICLAVHPYNNVVNSVIIGKVKSKQAAGELH